MSATAVEAGSRPVGPGGEVSPFLHWVIVSGDEGRRWAEAYLSSEVRGAAQLSVGAVDVVRAGRHHEGLQMLRQARLELDALRGTTPASVYSVLERWYYGALGFYFYAIEQFDEADDAMVRAHAAVARAIKHQHYLLPLVIDCSEFHTHRARIARNRRDWAAMHEHCHAALEMRVGERPFCVLGDGREVWLRDVQAFFRSIPSITLEDWGKLAYIVDDAWNRANIERGIRRLYRLPGFVIQYA